MSQISKLTGVTYKQIHCLFNQANIKCSKRKITQEQCLSVYKSVLKSTASMQIPYRRFAQYFYLRESLCDTYNKYVQEQNNLGLCVLSLSAMYKNLPHNLQCQNRIPFMECLCVKCLNFSHIIDALKAIGLHIPQRALLNVLASICPILVDKDKFGPLPSNNSSKIEVPVQKKSAITFGSIEEVEFTSKSLNVKTKCITKVENNTREIKHDPNKYLMDVNNAPSDLSVESVVVK